MIRIGVIEDILEIRIEKKLYFQLENDTELRYIREF